MRIGANFHIFDGDHLVDDDDDVGHVEEEFLQDHVLGVGGALFHQTVFLHDLVYLLVTRRLFQILDVLGDHVDGDDLLHDLPCDQVDDHHRVVIQQCQRE